MLPIQSPLLALAELSHVARRGWHSLRRKFACEMKQTPLRDLAYLGGWKSPETVLTVYQQPDTDTMARALEQRGTLPQTAIK